MNLFGGTISNLERGLNYSSVKQKTLANNIANVDTPGYKAQDVSFQSYLQEAQIQAKKTNEKHVNFGGEKKEITLFKQTDTSYNHNGNNVDIEKEMTELAENAIYQQALVQRISGKFNSLQSVIKGGK